MDFHALLSDRQVLLVAAYLVMINLVTFILFYVDKQEFRRHRHPHGIKAHTFILLALLGGSLGELLGMVCFRHKLHHKEYKVLLPIIFLVQVALILVVLQMYCSTEVNPLELEPA